jgi:cell division septum initiation protein DivIVA
MSENIPADALIEAIREPETPPPPAEVVEEPDIPDALPVPPRLGEILELVDELIIAVEGARNVPLSSSVMLDRSQLLQMLYRLRDEMPDEMRQARWMVREREQFVARTNEKAREMLDRARERSDELIAESYIVKEAVEEANHLIRHAESEATRIRLEAEDMSEKAFESAEELLADLLSDLRRQRAELHQARRSGVSEE